MSSQSCSGECQVHVFFFFCGVLFYIFGRLSIKTSMSRSLRSIHILQTNVRTLDGQNRQSPIASVQRTQSTLASHSAILRGTNVKQMNANRAIRITAQRTQGLSGLIFCVSRGRYGRQRTPAIRIAAITLASDSAITLARFRPSKVRTGLKGTRLVLRVEKLTRSNLSRISKRDVVNPHFRAEKTMTATDVTGFDPIFSTGFFAPFSRF